MGNDRAIALHAFLQCIWLSRRRGIRQLAIIQLARRDPAAIIGQALLTLPPSMTIDTLLDRCTN